MKLITSMKVRETQVEKWQFISKFLGCLAYFFLVKKTCTGEKKSKQITAEKLEKKRHKKSFKYNDDKKIFEEKWIEKLKKKIFFISIKVSLIIILWHTNIKILFCFVAFMKPDL